MADKINCVLLDLDGTLADTAPDLADTINQLLAEENHRQLDYEVIRPTVSHGGAVMICRAFGIDVDDPEFARLRRRFLDLYASRLALKSRLFPGMELVLNTLEAGNISWGVVTNKPAWLTDPLMQALDLAHRAGCIVSGDTVEYSKPHPAPMIHACRMTGCEPARTLYVGDARRDIQAGRSAGMFTLVALYGYLEPDDDPACWGATDMVDAPLAILDWLSHFNGLRY